MESSCDQLMPMSEEAKVELAKSLPKYRIIGSNQALKAFLWDCGESCVPVSKKNSFFREDYEHCLMPCYAYDPKQPFNLKLQTLCFDSYATVLFFDLEREYDKTLEFVEKVAEAWQKAISGEIDLATALQSIR